MFKLFCTVGEDSMYYYVIHWIYLKIWVMILTFFELDLFLLFVLVPITLLLSKRYHILDRYTNPPGKITPKSNL